MKSAPAHRPAGMFGFVVVWLGQIVSVLASAMSQFGLTIWMYDQTKSALAMGMMQVFFITPFLLISPIAGVMVDRHNRKLMMMVSDLAAGVATLSILALQYFGALQFWHLYVTSIVYGLGMAFQWPAYSAAISTMVPKQQYGRANGLMSLIDSGPGILAPMLAGILLAIPNFNGLAWIMTIDVVTFFIAIGALLIVHVPQPVKTEEGQKESGSIWREAAYGFRYIFQRPSLLGLQVIFFFGNLFAGIQWTVFTPSGTLGLALPLSAGLNGKEVYKGTSPIKDKVGEKLFDEKISIIDDGTIDGKFASASFDDEGVPHRRNVLVEKGILKGFIYDLKTAAQSGVESTGNASRQLFTPPEPSFTNFVIQPGQTPLKDILSGIDEGIIVEDLLGIGQGNTISGAFSNPLALAFKIEKGEIVGRVKDLSIAGNIYDLLKNVAAVSQEAQWVYSTFYAPYILIPEMNVAGKG